jgi:sulfofructose kinase
VLADVRWAAGAAFVFDAARAARILTVLDADVGPVAALRDLCARCDYAIFSQPGLNVASGAGSPGEGLRRMQQITRGVVSVTLGADGFLWLEAAGDVFHAAFALAIGEGAAIAAAAAFANAAAALKCTRFGGRDGAPTRPEVEALLRNGGWTL